MAFADSFKHNKVTLETEMKKVNTAYNTKNYVCKAEETTGGSDELMMTFKIKLVSLQLKIKKLLTAMKRVV